MTTNQAHNWTQQGRLDDPELRAEAYRLTRPFVGDGSIPGVGSPAWWNATDPVKLAGVLLLALAWLSHDPEQAVRQRLRQMSYDLSQAGDWAAAARHPSHAELVRRRAKPAPIRAAGGPSALPERPRGDAAGPVGARQRGKCDTHRQEGGTPRCSGPSPTPPGRSAA